eukprot:13825737-Alexandrium_andersonii.AAC.1
MRCARATCLCSNWLFARRPGARPPKPWPSPCCRRPPPTRRPRPWLGKTRRRRPARPGAPRPRIERLL